MSDLSPQSGSLSPTAVLHGDARGRDNAVRGELAAVKGVDDGPGRRLDSERFSATPRTCGRFRGILSLL